MRGTFRLNWDQMDKVTSKAEVERQLQELEATAVPDSPHVLWLRQQQQLHPLKRWDAETLSWEQWDVETQSWKDSTVEAAAVGTVDTL